MMTKSKVDVSAVVCTRNRGDRLVTTLESILANTHPNFEIIVIDQSTDKKTRQAVAPFLANSRMRYIHSNTVGTGNGRQIGLLEACGDLVAYTDDDCIVSPKWLETIHAIFSKEKNVAIVFCDVHPIPHDPTLGTVPSHIYQQSRTINSVRDYYQSIGMGAGMAVRRQTGLLIGGFDRNLGPGSKFYSAEDHDIALRALYNDQAIHETHEVAIIHDGFRTFDEFRKLTRRDWYAMGAVHAKYMKCKRWSIISIIAFNTFVRGLWQPISLLQEGKRPQGFRRFIYYWEGFSAGLRSPINYEMMLFKSTNQPENLLRKPQNVHS